MTRNDKIKEINQKLCNYYYFNGKHLSINDAHKLALNLNLISIPFLLAIYLSWLYQFWFPLVLLISIPVITYIYKHIFFIIKEPSSSYMIKNMNSFYIKDYIQSKSQNGDILEIVLLIPQDNIYVCKDFKGKIYKLTEVEIKKQYILIV